MDQKNTNAYYFTSIAALLIGIGAYAIGLFNAQMMLNEKGYYLIVLLYGLFSLVSLQKTIADDAEGKQPSKVYLSMCWVSSVIAIVLFCVGLYNAELLLSEKGFYCMAYVLSGFAAITVQKNIRERINTDSMQETEYLEVNVDSESEVAA